MIFIPVLFKTEKKEKEKWGREKKEATEVRYTRACPPVEYEWLLKNNPFRDCQIIRETIMPFYSMKKQ